MPKGRVSKAVMDLSWMKISAKGVKMCLTLELKLSKNFTWMEELSEKYTAVGATLLGSHCPPERISYLKNSSGDGVDCDIQDSCHSKMMDIPSG